MDPDQFAEFALGEAKRSPSGPHHDGQMGPPALFGTAFNNFFTTHKSVSPTNDKSMNYINNYTKNSTYINGLSRYFGSILMQIVSILGLILVINFIIFHFKDNIVGIYYE